MCLEEDPYPLAVELGLATVPTLFLVGRDGMIARVSEGWSRDDIEALASLLGVPPPLITPADQPLPFKPG